MSELTVNLPDELRQQTEAMAARRRMTVDDFVTSALASHVSEWQSPEHMEERARRGSWAKFKAVLAKAPDVEPEPCDKL